MHSAEGSSSPLAGMRGLLAQDRSLRLQAAAQLMLTAASCVQELQLSPVGAEAECRSCERLQWWTSEKAILCQACPRP